MVEIFRKAEMGISAVVSSDDVRYNNHTMDNITDFDIKDEIGFGRIFGLNEDEYNYVMDSLAYEGIISINRQMYPASIIRTASVDSIIPQIYSRVL